MRQKNIINLSDKNFRRTTGVKRQTFNTMVEIIRNALRIKKAKGGRPNKLTPEGMVLITLEYLREYRTYSSIGLNYGLSESSAFKVIRWVEETMIKDDRFKLPGKKELLKSDNEIEVILVDVTESPIERPKKNKNDFTQERKKSIH